MCGRAPQATQRTRNVPAVDLLGLLVRPPAGIPGTHLLGTPPTSPNARPLSAFAESTVSVDPDRPRGRGRGSLVAVFQVDRDHKTRGSVAEASELHRVLEQLDNVRQLYGEALHIEGVVALTGPIGDVTAVAGDGEHRPVTHAGPEDAGDRPIHDGPGCLPRGDASPPLVRADEVRVGFQTHVRSKEARLLDAANACMITAKVIHPVPPRHESIMHALMREVLCAMTTSEQVVILWRPTGPD